MLLLCFYDYLVISCCKNNMQGGVCETAGQISISLFFCFFLLSEHVNVWTCLVADQQNIPHDYDLKLFYM